MTNSQILTSATALPSQPALHVEKNSQEIRNRNTEPENNKLGKNRVYSCLRLDDQQNKSRKS